jgi:thiamine-phosphate pyrophosphorylase
VAVGPVYPTRSKPDPDPVVGLALVREAARTAGPLPVVAIGGITRARAAAVLEAGAWGLAVIGDLLDAADPGAVAGEFAALLGAAPGYDPRP